MKQLLKSLFFYKAPPNKIKFGPAGGMLVNYGIENRTLHLLGLYETEINSYLKKGTASADTLIDVGANDGYYAMAFLKKKNKRIILCEPGPIVKELRQNLALNNRKEGDNCY